MQAAGGATPLMYACQQCRENEVTEMLRRQPHSVKDRDRTLKTPLHYCAENPNSSCAEAVLKVAPELVNAQDENGYCTLHLAVIAGNKALIKLLLARGADVNVHDNEGHSAVHWAIVSSEKEALEMIIHAGADPSTPDIHGGFPLHYAVQMCGCNCEYVRNFEDTVRVVETLLNFGVDVSVKDKDGRQPILWAASAGSADAIIHLVSGGACVEAADKDGLTALHCAASRGHTTALETLISLCGANVDVIDGNGCSALFYSVTLGHADATELLLQLGADPNRQDRKGRTPAHCGAAKGQLETLRILQKHGGNLWMRNVKGDIPLHEAVASGRKDLVLWLLSQCPEAINIANNDGRCPIHIASMYNNTEMVKVLLDCKSLVNPVMRTSKGVLMTPLNVALSKGHRSCGKYLQLHGGVPFSRVSNVEPAPGFAFRVSPSDDAVIIVSENDKENVTPSHSIKISKSRSSTDIQENREIVKGETTDKKKVYRRRKKKKSQSNVQTQDSDSDDSVHDLKIKTPESRKSEKNNEDDEGENVKATKAHLGVKKRSQTNLTVDGKTAGQSAVSEELTTPTKVSKSKSESKSLQRNKSFNETKNVSDLSPEDFPPMMQTVSHLDAVITEPDIEASKPENESESRQKNAEDVAVGQETRAPETKETAEGGEISAKTTPSANGETDAQAEKDGSAEESKASKNEKPSGDVEKIEREESSGQEKSTKTPDAKKPNGGTRKDEGSRKSSDESSGRKSVKSTKSSSDGGSAKKDSRPVKKSNGVGEGTEKRRKTASPKDSKTTDRSEEKSSEAAVTKDDESEKSANAETGTAGDAVQDEKPRTEDEAITKEIKDVSADASQSKAQDLSQEITKSENGIADNKAETNAQAKSLENVESSSNFVIAEKEQNATVSADKEETDTQPSGQIPNNETPFTMTVEADVERNDTNGSEKNGDGVVPPHAVDKPEQKTEEPAEKPLPEITIEQNTPEKKKASDAEITRVIVTQEPVEENLESRVKRSVEFSEAIIEKSKEENSPSAVQYSSSNEPANVSNIVTGDKEPVNVSSRKDFIATEDKKGKDTTDIGNSIGSSEDRNSKETGNISSSKDPASTTVNGSKDLIVSKEKNGKDTTNVSTPANSTISRIKGLDSGDGGMTHEEEPAVTAKLEDENKEAKETEDANEVEADGEEGSPRKGKGSEERHFRTPRVSRLCRRNRDFKNDMNQISVTQLVQNTIRKYHMERGIFYQLLELKRYQIRSGKANEQVLVKRLADEYERSRVFLGMKPFTGVYKFREFEKFLYDQLKALNSRRSFIIPEVKSYDDIDALSGFLKKSRYKIINETPPPEMVCTCITQRCHHSACAYTNVPCSAYITDLRRHRHHRPKRESFFPRIAQKSEIEKHEERPATLELIQGSEKHVITLPQNSPAGDKRYYVTFTIKGVQGLKEEDFAGESKDYLKHRHAKSV